MNLQDFRLLSAGHALHALSPEDEFIFARALTEHPEWQSIVDDDLETAAELGDAVPNATPSASLRGNLLELIRESPQAAAAGQPAPEPETNADLPRSEGLVDVKVTRRAPVRSGHRRAIWVGAFALAASLAVVSAVTFGPELFGPNTTPAIEALTEVSQATDAQVQTVEVAGGGEATLHWSHDLSRAVLVAEGLPKLGADKDVELWLVRGETPISVGVLDSDAESNVLAGFKPGDVVALTVEAAGGSPSGAPTTEPIAAIVTT